MFIGNCFFCDKFRCITEWIDSFGLLPSRLTNCLALELNRYQDISRGCSNMLAASCSNRRRVFRWVVHVFPCLNLVPWSNVINVILPRELFDMLDYDGGGTIGIFGRWMADVFPNLVRVERRFGRCFLQPKHSFHLGDEQVPVIHIGKSWEILLRQRSKWSPSLTPTKWCFF